MHHSAMKSEVRRLIADGTVIPAHPLALDASRALDITHQRALTRYYIDAGAGGLAVGVHTTQFAIRDVGLYRPVLELAAETAAAWTRKPLALVAGLAGPTRQAVAEAEIARGIGYHAGLLSLAAMKSASEHEIIAHCETVAREIPLVGFYLQPAVGGVILSADFWRRFAGIDNVIAIKIAPFNRYRTLDVLRGVAAAGALDRVALYTGNDDHILLDLTLPFDLRAPISAAVCLATGRYGPQTPSSNSRGAAPRVTRTRCHQISWRSMPGSPTATARSSTSPTIFAAASPAVTKFCGGKACWRESGVSIRPKV